MTLPLFRRDIQVVPLGSESKGNSTWVGDGTAGVLIDCGISTRQILTRMASVGLGDAPIDAVLITHEHSDHVGSARILCNKLRKRTGKSVPFFMTAGTRAGTHARSRADAVEEVKSGERFKVRHLDIEAFPVPHDVRDPVGFRVGLGGTWAGVVTDLGRPTALVTQRLASLRVAVLEFNHDEEMLMEGPYPWSLKQRIRSTHGHLSNRQSAGMLMAALAGDNDLQHVILAHLSDENNSPARARAACELALAESGAEGHVQVHVAQQASALPPIRVASAGW